MNIKFRNKRLEKLANDSRKCIKEMGQIRGKLFLRRLNDLLDASNLEKVLNSPGNYHELTGNRKCQYIWFEIVGIEVIEIVDYH